MINGQKLIKWLILFLIIFRFYLHSTAPKVYKNGDTIRITARVASEPIRYDSSQYIKLNGLKIYLPLYPEIFYGDIVVIEGTVDADKLVKPKLVKLTLSQNFLYLFRRKLLDFYQSSLPSSSSALVAGMAIGSKSGIPQDFWESLKNTGTAHVVVASGMNVSLLAGFLLTFFTLFLKRGKALILTFVGIWLYALLSGFEAPIVRAAIMGTIGFTAQGLGRLSFAVRTLIFSAFLMVMAKPEWLVDVGFLLSFFATLSLVLFQKRIYKYMKFVPKILREDLSTSLAAQIGVAPILYFTFGQFNILSPIINVMVLWTVPLITILGMLGGILGLAVPDLGKGILFLAYPLTLWFTWMIDLFS